MMDITKEGDKMPPIKSTIWSIDPHTKAKHEVLEYYLKAWVPILATTSKKIIYLDGFAGPGIYEKGEEGSPLIALRTAIEHVHRLRFKAEIRFIFLEKDPERATMLRKVLKERFEQLPSGISYDVLDSQFAPTLSSILDELEEKGAKLAPTFAFLDPFGFSGLPMNLIGRMLNYDKCEVLITFMSGFVNRFTDELREQALDELFAASDWRRIREIGDPGARQRFLIELYTRQLRDAGGATYVKSFEMVGKHNQPLYHLVYGTKHLKGLEHMKEAMWKVDRRGTYTFSDITDVGQTFLIDYSDENYWQQQAADAIFDRFVGQTKTIEEIYQFVIVKTPYIFRKSILKHLEKRECPKIIKVTNRNRKLTYPEGCSITFRINSTK